jgi:hypothetical protein
MEEEPDIEENNDKTYKSCCFSLDKNFVRYVTQISIYYIILSLAIYKLITIEDKTEDRSIWISLVTMILGIVTESTKLKRKSDRTLDEPRQSQSL